MNRTKGQRIERGVFVGVSIAMIFLSVIAWVAAHQAGPPPMTSLLLSLLPFGFIMAAVDSLARLRPLVRLGIGIYTSLLALVCGYLALGMLIGNIKGDSILPITVVAFLLYHNLRINRWWRPSANN